MLSFLETAIARLRMKFVNDGVSAEEIEAMVKRSHFSKLLPYRAYDAEDCYYLNVDDSFGLIWEVVPLVYASSESYNGFEQIVENVPKGSTVQVILYADPHVDPIVEEYLSMRDHISDDDAAAMAARTASFFKTASINGFEKISRIPCRNFRCFVAVKLSLKNGFDNDAKFVRDSIKEVLRGAKLNPREVDPQILCDWLQRIFNDEADLPSPGMWNYNEQRPINEQIVLNGTSTKIRYDHIKLGSEKHVSTQTIMEYPPESLDNLTMNKVMGGIWGHRNDGDQCNFPFLVSVSIVTADLRHMFHGKASAMMVQDKRGSSAGFKMEKQNEMAWAATETDRGKRFVRVIPTILTFSGNRKAANENTARIKNLWGKRGFLLNRERGIAGPLFLMSLPLGLYATKKNIEWLKRDRIMPTASAVRMLPLQGDFSGYGRPVTMLVGRKGQIVPIDIFNPDASNNNVLISASTGKGKSYLMNRLLTDFLDTKTDLRVFDIGRSYKKICELKKGNYICFDENSRVCLNPYSNLNPYSSVRKINEEINIIGLNISQMVWSSTKEKPTETQMSIIKNACRYVWDTMGTDGDPNHVRKALNDFGNVLKYVDGDFKDGKNKLREIAEEIAFNIGDFTGKGPYTHWFNGKATINISRERFVVLELVELFQNKELFNVVVPQIVNYVTQNLYLSKEIDRPRVVVFDEAHEWFKEGSFLGDVIQNGYRQVRKYWASFITIFQSMSDLKEFGHSGSVLKTNSAFKFYLESDDGYDQIKKDGLIKADRFMLDLFNSVRLQKGFYSEVMVETPHNTGVARLPSDPISHLIYTSDPCDKAIIRQHAKEKGLSELDAIFDLTSKAA